MFYDPQSIVVCDIRVLDSLTRLRETEEFFEKCRTHNREDDEDDEGNEHCGTTSIFLEKCSHSGNLVSSLIFEIDRSRDSDRRVIISDDGSPLPSKSYRDLHADIGMDKWANEAGRSTDVIERIPGIPWIFLRIDEESDTFHIDIVRKEIDPVSIISK